MISLILILPLISAASSPKSDNLSACEFIAPLADFEIVRSENLLHFPNGTFRIPLQKAPSGERSNLYFNENEVFYWNSVGQKKVHTKEKLEIGSRGNDCHCLEELIGQNPSSKLIGEVWENFCTKSDCMEGKIDGWLADSYCRNIMDFEHLKKEMKVNNVLAEGKKIKRAGPFEGYRVWQSKLK